MTPGLQRLLVGVALSMLAGSAVAGGQTRGAAEVRVAPAAVAEEPMLRSLPSPALRASLQKNVRGFPLDETRLRAHVIAPAHVVGVITDRGLTAADLVVRLPKGGLSLAPHLDTVGFGQDMAKALKNQTAGYVLALRKNGQPIYAQMGGYAVEPSRPWTLETPMHVASVSKLITAMAMTKLLDAKGVSYDAKIKDYLPTYWARGANIDKITFRQLMTQTSGFSTGGSSSDYVFMKGKVAAGVPAASVGTYDYENMNFGLCRILISVINGNIDKDATFGSIPESARDILWDALTIQAYQFYVQEKVFTPAGVNGPAPTLDHPDADALAYSFPSGTAWNSGDVSSYSGGAAWHMSANQLLDVMSTFRRKVLIMSNGKAQAMMDNGFGLDVVGLATPAGKLYNKNGRWQNGGKAEQSLAYFLPEGMELVVLANSPVTGADTFFRTVVTDAYVANIK